MNKKFKSGATSIYVVVIATLLFSVITVSFIRIIVNEANRTTSDELAQSAYDSALAGVEDAKVALKKYYECASSDSSECENIRSLFQESVRASRGDGGYEDNPCSSDAVPKILGRNSSSSGTSPDGGEVLIQETKASSGNPSTVQTVQAYTCVLLNDELADYRSELSSALTTRVIPIRTDGDSYKNVTGIQIAWYDEIDEKTYNFKNDDGEFGAISSAEPTPPTISVQLIQTAPTYSLSDLDTSVGNKTDRGTVFLVPSDNRNASTITHVGADTLTLSNDHATKNTPVLVDCKHNDYGAVRNNFSDEFACVANIAFPDPVGSTDRQSTLIDGVESSIIDRNKDTFFLVVSLPYGTPATKFSVKLCIDKDATCSKTTNFKEAQIAIDSTGRANDMYSRVEARVEFNDIYFPFPEFAIQATGSGYDAINKNFYVTTDCWGTDSTGAIKDCNNSGS